MPGRIFFRDECASVTSTELVIGRAAYPLAEVLSARGARRRSLLRLLHLQQYSLVITTASGEHEVLRHRNGYLVFQLAKAVETALRELRPLCRTQALPHSSPTPATSALTNSMAT